MKKLVLVIVAVFVFGIITGYTQESSIFDKFEDYDEVTTVVVTQYAFKMLKKISNNSKENKEFQELVGGLDELKVFKTEDSQTAKEMQSVFHQYLKKAKLAELMRVKDKDANVKIYVREGKDEDHISEFLMLVDEMNIQIKRKNGEISNPEVVIVSLTGHLNLNQISEITKDMNLPGAKHVEKAEKE